MPPPHTHTHTLFTDRHWGTTKRKQGKYVRTSKFCLICNIWNRIVLSWHVQQPSGFCAAGRYPVTGGRQITSWASVQSPVDRWTHINHDQIPRRWFERCKSPWLFLWVNSGSKWVKASHYNSSLLGPPSWVHINKELFQCTGSGEPLFRHSPLSPILALNPQQLSRHFSTGVGRGPLDGNCGSLLAWENRTVMFTCSCQQVY